MMEETANPTPSSTLAPEMPATAEGGPKANKTSIKLLIKASNQQHDDQIIESDLMWTVYRLKTQLSLVYPSKPPVAEQKLIYSGQLLSDTLQLKDVIRSYKDVYTQNHILHLVYTPKNQPLQKKVPSKMATPKTTTEGLRHRHNGLASSSSGTHSSTIGNSSAEAERAHRSVNLQQIPTSSFGFMGQQPIATTSSGTNNSSGMPFANAFDMQSLALQQAAMYNWMWQTYGHYMQQYHQASAAQSMPGESTNNSTPPASPLNPVIAAFPSFNPAAFFAQPYLIQQTQTPTTNNAPSAQPAEPLQQEQQQQQQQQAQQQEQPQEAAPPQPRFLNIVQEEQENRDWLDSFFSIMRLALFLTILYFNSSAIRCLIVFIIAGGIYLYHIGFFRIRPERNNNDINRNNNDAEENGEQQDLADDEPNAPLNAQNNESAAATSTDAANADDPASIAAQDAVAADNNSTSVIAFMRTFIVTFFTSLLPETPAAL